MILKQEGAAIQQEREKWRNGHTDELIWINPEEEERRIIKDEQIRIRNAVSALSTGDFTVLDVLAIIVDGGK
jgi:hypothetical protein